MLLVHLLTGVMMLMLGRQLFWLFVAGLGVVVGIDVVAPALSHQPAWLVVLTVLGAGLLGGIVALVWQWGAIGIAGFLAGGYIALHLLDAVGWTSGSFTWWAFLLGGVFGAALMVALFDWALIFLSSLSGAAVIVHAIPLDPLSTPLAFSLLAVSGVAIQTRLWRKALIRSSS